MTEVALLLGAIAIMSWMLLAGIIGSVYLMADVRS